MDEVEFQNFVEKMRQMQVPKMEFLEKDHFNFDNAYIRHFESNLLNFLKSSSYLDQLKYNFFYRLKDQIVLDLGAGSRYGAYQVLTQFGIKGYIANDFYYAEDLRVNLESFSKNESMKIPFTVFNEDMNTTLSRLPNNSVSIVASGLDDVITDFGYLNLTKSLIKEKLHPNGIFISNSSPIGFDIGNSNFETGFDGWNLYVYPKEIII